MTHRKIEHWKKVKARLRQVRESQPYRSSEQAYAQLERFRLVELAEKELIPDLPYITP